MSAERASQSLEAVLFPYVDHLGPVAGTPDDTPDAEAELVAILHGGRAPIRRHVVHVAGPVVADDVDEFVDVDLLIHGDPQA